MSFKPLSPHPVLIPPPDLTPWCSSSLGIPYVHERDSGRPGPEILISSLVHGNEYCGAWALDAFLRTGIVPRRGRITTVFCNVAALERFDSQQPDLSRYVDEDFNRVWSIECLNGSGNSTELKRAREIRPLVERATFLLDMHSMHEPGPPLLVTGLLDRNLRLAQSLKTGYQAVVDAGHTDGVRLTDFGAFSSPTGEQVALGLEVGQHWEESSPKVAKDVLMRFLIFCDVLSLDDVPAGWLQPDAEAPLPVTVTHRIVARSMEFRFVQNFVGGEVIPAAGSVIAFDGSNPVTTPYDNCVLVMPSVRQLRPGVTTVRLGRR